MLYKYENKNCFDNAVLSEQFFILSENYSITIE